MNLRARLHALWARCREPLGEPYVPWTRVAAAIQWGTILLCCLGWEGGRGLSAATVPAGFSESVIGGPSGGSWNDAVGITFESNGRMYVWGRGGKVWFKDPADSSPILLLDISEEVGAWMDHGLVGFAFDPSFRLNGYIYLFYVVDRHYLLHYGTPEYDPTANEYQAATIGRLTRYTCRSSDGFRSVDLASRRILIGETKETGIPILQVTHGVGSIVFGEDGTLLVSCGDGASPYAADVGSDNDTYYVDALADHIIRDKENIGAYRSQLVDCLNGKILRIDPDTGDGVPSNPFYDAANPRSARSRVWALGLRNPCRMTLKPGAGSHYPPDGNPGILYVGDVGRADWEEMDVVKGPGRNFGWPLFEGLWRNVYYEVAVPNRDAPNPLYPASGCSQYFSFRDLLQEDTLDPAGQPPFPNPCRTSQKIPSSIPQFLHTRPVLDWYHGGATTRTPIYDSSGQAQTAHVGDPGSPVSGAEFQGNCSIGGVWYTGTTFPPQYRNTYFHADWGQGWIKSLVFDQNDHPVAVREFLSGGGFITFVGQHPADRSLYYVSFDYHTASIKKVDYTGNRTPVAVASADRYYGPGPLTVQFSSVGSSDPDGQAISYSWNFGDGSPVSTQANPSHSFSAPSGVPTGFAVTLTVTDSGGLAAQTSLRVAVNDTPPNVTITSPLNGSLYPANSATTKDLVARVNDAESGDAELLYEWQTVLHHNDHNHGSPADTNHVTRTVISPTECDGINIYYYRIILTVTDPQGLSTTQEVDLYPDCGVNTAPTISDIPDQTTAIGTAVGPINFTVGDAETAPDNLQLSATSSNPTLVPTNNIVFGGSGANRTVTVTPAASQTGTATIRVTVSDGANNASDTFVLTVTSSGSGTVRFSNPSAITIPSLGAATPYPSTINVSGMAGTIRQVSVTLKGLTHTYPDDLDLLLVGPTGQKVLIMSDVGGGIGVNNVNLTLSDGAASGLPDNAQIVSGTFKPTDFDTTSDTFPAPAPAGPYGATLSAFNGQGANGTWSLYVNDDGPGDQGSFSGGWSLTISTSGLGPAASNPSAITIPSLGAATPYPSTINVSGMAGTIRQVSVTLKGLTHTYPDDLDLLLVGPTGQKVLIMSDVGGGIGVNNVDLALSDAAASGLPDNAQIVSGTFKPTDFDTTNDTFPAPAPAGPYGATLSAFNGQGANGTWSLYVNDDGPGDQGSFNGGWSLTISTSGLGPAAIVSVEESPRVTSVELDDRGAFLLTVTGEAGRSYVLEASSDLIHWTKAGVEENKSGSVVFSNQVAASSSRFYRAVSEPRVNNQ